VWNARFCDGAMIDAIPLSVAGIGAIRTIDAFSARARRHAGCS
jgi:hypothetical protein